MVTLISAHVFAVLLGTAEALALAALAVTAIRQNRFRSYAREVLKVAVIPSLIFGVGLLGSYASIGNILIGIAVLTAMSLLGGYGIFRLKSTKADFEAKQAAEKAEADRIAEERRQRRPIFEFCPNCATKLVERDFNGKKKLACPSCTFVHWDNPREVAVVLVPAPDRSGRLLLIKRLIAPRIGCFALPGGFVDKGEGPEEAAIREVFEETGIIVKIERHLRSVPIPQANQILTFYLATAIGGTLTNSHETDAVDYYSPEALPGEIAFPTHLEAIQTWAKQGNNA